MPVLKNKVNKNFTKISNTILRDKELNIKDRGVLCTILCLPDNWEFSVKGLAALLPDGYETVNNSFIRLLDKGYIKRTYQRNKLGRYESIIEVVTNLENIQSGLSGTGNPDRITQTGYSDSENPEQYNIQNNKSKYNNINEKEGMNDWHIPDFAIRKIKENINYNRLQDMLSEQEFRYVEKITEILAKYLGAPPRVAMIKISGRYIKQENKVGHILAYKYDEVIAVAKNMHQSNVGISKPDSYYFTALEDQLKKNSPLKYAELFGNETN